MSFPFKIPPGSPLEAIRDWKPDDLLQFAGRAASGLDCGKLAKVSEVEEEVVEALLAEPVIALVVEDYGKLLSCSDEEFREKLRPMVGWRWRSKSGNGSLRCRSCFCCSFVWRSHRPILSMRCLTAC